MEHQHCFCRAIYLGGWLWGYGCCRCGDYLPAISSNTGASTAAQYPERHT